MLLDSNVIIYSAQPENEFLRQLIAEKAPAVSAVRLASLRILNPFNPGQEA